jgi:acetyl-CoA carboxylase carboxyl transferase subunit alpha
MVKHYLDFEKPLVELEREIEYLRRISQDKRVHFDGQLKHLEERLYRLQKDIFSNLNAWQVTQLAKHINRPKSLQYIQGMSEGFIELHGDRTYGDDPAIVGGICKLEGRSVVLIGQQKGSDAREMIYRNFGMPHPEGYRKALRLMKMAEVFRKPIITLIDTPGAYPGAGAEERGQAEAIARNLTATHLVTQVEYLSSAVPVFQAQTASGEAYHSDSRMLLLDFSPGRVPTLAANLATDYALEGPLLSFAK